LRCCASQDWPGIANIRPTPQGSEYRDGWLDQKYATRMQFVNAVFRQGGEHKYAYDEETLVLAFRLAGFAEVTVQSFGISRDPQMAPDLPARRLETLYVEDVKPSG
jgi:hypothetical protein